MRSEIRRRRIAAVIDYNWNSGGGSPAPSEQAHDIVFTVPTSSTVTVSWTRGNGAFVIVLAKIASVVDSFPVNDTTYTANATFGSGDELGTDNFVVYIGTGTSFSMSHDGESAKYNFRVFEFNGEAGAEKYNTDAAVLNPESIATELLLSGLMHRLAFDELLAAVADGANVPATITDTFSGTVWNPPAVPPTVHTDAEGGFKFMRIIANSRIRTATKMDFLHTGPSTIIFVMKRRANIDTTILFDTRDNVASNIGRSILLYYHSEIWDIARSSAGILFSTTGSTQIFPISDGWDAVVFTYENGSTGNDNNIQLNGLSIIGSETVNAPAAGTSSSDTSLGRRSTNAGLSAESDFALALWFNRKLTATQIDQVLGSRDEYGLEP